MKLIYSRPILRDLSQGSRIAFARQFRLKTQDNVRLVINTRKTRYNILLKENNNE